MTDTAREAGQEGLATRATSQVQDAASSAQDKAVEMKEEGKGKLAELLDERARQAGGQAHAMARALRRSGEELRAQEHGDQLVGVTESAAERIERLGSYLDRASGDELLRDVEHFARRRPWLIAGFGLLAGLTASRFLKASSERRYADSSRSRPASLSETSDANHPLTRERIATSG